MGKVDVMNDELEDLIAAQSGMVARRQLNQHGIDSDRVRNQVAVGRWVVRTPRVISTTTGTLDRDQWLWLAVLHAGPRSMLANLSAAARHGLSGWQRAFVSVMVDDELSFEPIDGIDFFRSRRPFDLMKSPKPGIPTCELEPAVLLWAGYEATPRAAHGVIVSTMQQRLTTAKRLIEWIDLLRPLRRARAFKETVSHAEGGAHSMAEVDVGLMCRQFGMPQPARQVPRTDRVGRKRWTDAEWELDDGTVIVLEVDGGYHLDIVQVGEDYKRTRRLVGPRRIVVRCTAYELRHEAAEVAADLMALGVPGRVPPNAA